MLRRHRLRTRKKRTQQQTKSIVCGTEWTRLNSKTLDWCQADFLTTVSAKLAASICNLLTKIKKQWVE